MKIMMIIMDSTIMMVTIIILGNVDDNDDCDNTYEIMMNISMMVI